MPTGQVSRRTVARGAAWSVPVAAVGVAAPAFAASAPGPTAVINSLCNCSGRKYRIQVTFTNPYAASFSLTNMSVAMGNETLLAVTPATGTVNGGPGTTVLTFVFTRSNNGTFTDVSLTYSATNNTTNVTSAPQTATLVTGSAATCTSPTC